MPNTTLRFWPVLIVAAFCTLLAVGCGSASVRPTDELGSGSAQAALSTQQSADALASLPALSSLQHPSGAARSTSLAPETIDGAGFDKANAGVNASGSAALFDSGSSGLAYAIYRFNALPTDYLSKLTVQTSARSGGQIWVGLSNFQSLRWEFLSSTDDNAEFDLQNATNTFSNGQYFYVAVLDFGAGAFSLNSVTLTYGAAPFPGWQNVWGSVDGFEVPEAVAFDSVGNSIVLGNYDAPSPAADEETCALLKYSPSGTLLKAITFTFDADDSSFGTPGVNADDLLIDASDNVYVTGGYAYWPDNSGLNSNDGCMIKLNSSFEIQWVRRLRRSSSDGIGPMALDSNGNIRAVASFSTGTGGGDFHSALLTVTPNGDLTSQQLIGGQLGGLLEEISLDSATQDIYLSGHYGTVFDGQPYWVKINSNGSLAWAGQWSGASGATAWGIIGDGSGGAHVVCNEPFPGYGSDTDDAVMFLDIAADGTLAAAQCYEIPGVDLNPDRGKLQGDRLRLHSTYYDSTTFTPGCAFFDIGADGAAGLGSTLFLGDFFSVHDWDLRSNAWVFTDSVLSSIDDTQPSASFISSGGYVDVTDGLSISDDMGTLSAWDATWTSESGTHSADVVAEVLKAHDDGTVDGFEFLTTYLPISET